jgi:hypothetical protein
MKLKQLFENTRFPSSKEEVESILNKYKITNYTINDDLTVDVDGGVDLYGKSLTVIPVQFGKVTKYFDCSGNQLASLQGAPREVSGGFWCHANKLISLQGAPREVGGSFKCSENQLTSLKGSPREVGRDFWCFNNPMLKTLEGIGNVDGEIVNT